MYRRLHMHLLCIEKLKISGAAAECAILYMPVGTSHPTYALDIMRASPEFSSCRLHHLHTKYDHDSKLGDRPDLTPTSLLVGLAQGGDALLCIPVLESARIATPPETGSMSPTQKKAYLIAAWRNEWSSEYGNAEHPLPGQASQGSSSISSCLSDSLRAYEVKYSYYYFSLQAPSVWSAGTPCFHSNARWPPFVPVHRPRVKCQLAIGLAFYATPGAVQAMLREALHQSEAPTAGHQAGACFQLLIAHIQ
ncbi:uncharacterized protein TRIVIDRAFT_200930 [Trichoderma virens Gv29-8]|uniref:Uncharacterized protein n=1 Tax=Hypocrea virens (strain Gv29-8 / FGSC 10586) TaxID=413071 RepID=G9MRB2_HYPVG|nr:uncharacterized protein TRIVIDRAFT_200930 [Trichoderma virens Gv29-8]EHK22636.1 hypothetical protein TRIVIDRAFT_200930 [Trichoderma virens Gv29-8]